MNGTYLKVWAVRAKKKQFLSLMRHKYSANVRIIRDVDIYKMMKSIRNTIYLVTALRGDVRIQYLRKSFGGRYH